MYLTGLSVAASQKGQPLDWKAELNLEPIRWLESSEQSSLMDPRSF